MTKRKKVILDVNIKDLRIGLAMAGCQVASLSDEELVKLFGVRLLGYGVHSAKLCKDER